MRVYLMKDSTTPLTHANLIKCAFQCGGVPFGHKLQNRVVLCLSPSENVGSHSSVESTENAGYFLCLLCLFSDFCYSLRVEAHVLCGIV